MKKLVNPFLNSILISFSILGYIFFQNSVYTSYITQTYIGVKLINSYSGFINRNSGQNMISSGGILWTNNMTPSIMIGANTGSNFLLSGDVQFLTGQGTGNYNIPTTITLLSGNNIKFIQAIFSRDSEPYNSNILNTMIDTLPPSLPNILGPNVNSIMSGLVIFSWTDSIDYGIGLSHYNIHISLDPGFFSQITIISSGNNLQIPSSSLPQGTLFWYIEAVDFLGNSINTNPIFFHNGQPSIIDSNTTSNSGGNYSGGGGTTGSYTNNNSYNSVITGQYNSGVQTNTGLILSGNTIKNTTGTNIESGSLNTGVIIGDNGYKDIIKNTLLAKFNGLQNNIKGNIVIPNQQDETQQHNIATIKPDALMYNNLLGLHYYHLNPLGYTMNIISRLLIPFYYLLQGLQYYLITKKSVKF